MNLYAAYNGYTGESTVMALVLAEDETQALELARESFRRDEMSYSKYCQPRPGYWENVKVKLLAPCDKPFATRPSDGGVDLWEANDPEPVTRKGIAGDTILEHALLYFDTDGKLRIFTGHILQNIVGVALHNALSNQEIEYLVSGEIK